ncbi:MAG: SUMF1/EgtB/PvdO family nonheme iron enzyme, partial [Verrucomicrobiae bacterium]|nr:SUMF1/EgtB/PvdO family nonheme iron enzyme [Verrucomicrobiae bacterium]
EGPASGSDRVFRGGSWSSYAWFCRAAFRSRNSPSIRGDYLGFRVALSSLPDE